MILFEPFFKKNLKTLSSNESLVLNRFFLADLSSKTIINAIDWRYIKDALSEEDIYSIRQENSMEKYTLGQGPKGYSTAGWLGLLRVTPTSQRVQVQDRLSSA